MGRIVNLDARKGGASPSDILFGYIEVQPTMLRHDGATTVFPVPTRFGLTNGRATLDLAPSPEGPEPAWAYRVLIRDQEHDRAWSEIVGVPAGAGAIEYADLERFAGADVIPPETTVPMLQNWVEATKNASEAAADEADRAEAAADRAEAPTDLMVTTLIEDPNSEFRASVDMRYTRRDEMLPFAHTEFKLHPDGFRYEVTRVNCNGTARPGILRKRYAGDFEATSPGGDSFIPPAPEPIQSFASRTGADVVFNSTGFQTTPGPTEGMIRGPQIKDGVIYRDFEPDSNRGRHALGVHADGAIRPYMVEEGWTAASMLADGVVDTFTFGPLLVKDGVERDIVAEDAWANSLTTGAKSARTILGATSDHDILLISVVGKSTPEAGVGGNDIAHLAYSEGCYNAILLDGGGSTQAMISGMTYHPSSDAARFRSIGDVGLIYARVSQAPDSSRPQGPEPVSLAVGIVASSAAIPPSVTVQGGRVNFAGRVGREGGIAFLAQWVVVGQIPDKARPKITDGQSAHFTVTGSGSAMTCKAQIRSNGELSVQPPAGCTYVDLSSISYAAF